MNGKGPRQKVAFIGLGVMGYPMAGHVNNAGMEVCVCNRTASKAAQWVEQYGGERAATPAAAAVGCDVVLVCVGDDEDVRQVVLGADGALAGMDRGAVLVDHTTASAQLARELFLAARTTGKQFLDAPVSGGQSGAENGILSIMVGGEEGTYRKARPVIDCYSRCSRLLGPAGNGQLAKMVNQICIAGVLQGLAEGLHFARQAGLDGEALIATLMQGAAGSWQMEHRHRTMLADEYEFGFAVDWMRKDLGIALAEAERMGLELSLTKWVDGLYAEVQEMGGGRWDTSSLLARLARKTGLSAANGPEQSDEIPP